MPEWLNYVFTPPALIAIGIIVGVSLLVKAIAPGVRAVVHFFDDLRGEPERPGVPKRPGIMEAIAMLNAITTGQAESLKRIETEQQAQAEKLEIVRHEVEFNNGSSVKDATRRTEEKLEAVERDVSDVKRDVTGIKDILGNHLTDDSATLN